MVETDKKIENRVPKPENFIRWKNIPIKKGRVVSKNGRYNIFVVIYTIDTIFKLLGFKCNTFIKCYYSNLWVYNIIYTYIYELILVFYSNSIN